MDRSIPMLLIGLVFGGGLGFMTAAANGVTLDGHDHDHDHHGGADSAAHAAMHEGPPQSLPQGANAPTLDIAVTPDPVSGWNLHVMTTHFAFAPEQAGLDHVAGEGHAHVYVNGKKIARLYGPWMHIGALPGDAATVTVTLNANDHRPLAVGDAPLSRSVEVGG
ncbi:hypothetical protein ACOXXX_17300 [Thalassococcus sp. BH17M4-6]|uniref:hypothetical protein n=1 Tax=Thalassococcus sp. BH17M4-6 TaxID=3413148 RepID=UPI003BD32A5A